jgi:CheY-like chemotaxis protein
MLRIVEDGEEAVKYLSGHEEYADRSWFPLPNIIITDLKMPRMDGFELLRWLRAHPGCSAIPAIVMSSSGRPEDVIKAYNLGANCYFVKPSGLDELVTMIKIIFGFWSCCERPPIVWNEDKTADG